MKFGAADGQTDWSKATHFSKKQPEMAGF